MAKETATTTTKCLLYRFHITKKESLRLYNDNSLVETSGSMSKNYNYHFSLPCWSIKSKSVTPNWIQNLVSKIACGTLTLFYTFS